MRLAIVNRFILHESDGTVESLKMQLSQNRIFPKKLNRLTKIDSMSLKTQIFVLRFQRTFRLQAICIFIGFKMKWIKIEACLHVNIPRRF